MKIHIVQRNDTFDSIAEKYNVSVQDLIGMNTHINHLTPLDALKKLMDLQESVKDLI